jgi:hypothetical protein
MRRWLWKIAEILVALGIVLLIVVPSSLESEFLRRLYGANPILCIILLTALGVFLVAMAVHVIQERRKKQSKKIDVVPHRGTL